MMPAMQALVASMPSWYLRKLSRVTRGLYHMPSTAASETMRMRLRYPWLVFASKIMW